MKKALFMLLAVVLFILGGCVKNVEETVKTAKASTTLTEVKEKEQTKETTNELVYEVDSNEKTITSTTKSNPEYMEAIEVPTGFKYISKPQGISITGEEEYEGIEVSIEEDSIKFHTDLMYEMYMSNKGGHDVKPIDDKELQKYEFNYQGIDKGGYNFLLAKKVKHHAAIINAYIPTNKYNKETKAIVLAILKSIKL